MYAGARRQFSGVGTIAAGFVALVLVLGALLTSELDRYGASDSQATDAASPPALTPGGPETTPTSDPAAPAAPAAPGGTADGARPLTSPRPSKTTVGDETNQAVLATVNRALTGLSCAKVAFSPALRKAAEAHLTAMIRTGYLTLVSPDGSDPGKRARAAGYRRNVLEAIVLGAETANEAAAIGFSVPATPKDAPPTDIRTESTGSLKCGYRSVGAGMRRDSRNVPITVIFLGK